MLYLYLTFTNNFAFVKILIYAYNMQLHIYFFKKLTTYATTNTQITPGNVRKLYNYINLIKID